MAAMGYVPNDTGQVKAIGSRHVSLQFHPANVNQIVTFNYRNSTGFGVSFLQFSYLCWSDPVLSTQQM
jgi:hypothetical protein